MGEQKKRHNLGLKTLMTGLALVSSVATVTIPSITGLTNASASKANLKLNTSSPQAFINSIGPAAQKIAAKHDMYASVMIAQALIESGSGQSTLAEAPNYNLFGIKGQGPAGTVNMSTKEDGAGGSYTTNAGFRKYHSFAESLQDNANVISSNALYSKAWRSNTKSYKDATAALQGTYATSTTYAQTLNDTIARYDLTRYDSSKFVKSTNVTSDGSDGLVDSLENLTDAQLLKKYNIKPDYKTDIKKTVTPILYKTTKTDSIWGIARQYKVSIENLLTWNPWLKSSDEKLDINTELTVGQNHHKKVTAYRNVTEHHFTKVTIKSGDSLWKIAHENHTTVANLEKLNNATPETNLYSGNKLKVKDTTKVVKHYLTDKEKEAADKLAIEKARAARDADEVKLSAQAENSDNTSSDSQQGATYTTSDESAAVKKVINLASSEIGKPYVWGAKGPNSFDCSGLMYYVFKNALGINIGGWTGVQQNAGTRISVNQAKPGDLYFWSNGGTSYHVALAIGNGKFIAAPRPGENVEVENVSDFTPQYAVRIIQSNNS